MVVVVVEVKIEEVVIMTIMMPIMLTRATFIAEFQSLNTNHARHMNVIRRKSKQKVF